MLRSQGRKTERRLTQKVPRRPRVLTRPQEGEPCKRRQLALSPQLRQEPCSLQEWPSLPALTATHGPTKSAHSVLAAYTIPTINLDNCPTLAIGYHGGCVDQLQTELNTVNGGNLSVDGTFGADTKATVEAFQQDEGISPADGIVGPQTKAALDNPVPNSVATPSPGAPITATSGGDSGTSDGFLGSGLDGWTPPGLWAARYSAPASGPLSVR